MCAQRQDLIDGDFVIAALYKFVSLPAIEDLQAPILALCEKYSVRGTLLLAPEGINGTIAGTRSDIDAVLDGLRAYHPFTDLEHKESRMDKMPFARLKVRLKKEIVPLGVDGVDPNHMTGEYVDAAEWNALLKDPDVVVIDTRNDYEVAIGTFPGAIEPETTTFREFPDWVRSEDRLTDKPRVAMFCTGGIRCEKASAFLRQEGFETVYQLRGGILKYLETVAPDDNQWRGECFVFDERVSVDEDLDPGTYRLCRACRRPLSEEDLKSPDYREGISCHLCISEHSDADRARFAERQRQITLEKKRRTGL